MVPNVLKSELAKCHVYEDFIKRSRNSNFRVTETCQTFKRRALPVKQLNADVIVIAKTTGTYLPHSVHIIRYNIYNTHMYKVSAIK